MGRPRIARPPQRPGIRPSGRAKRALELFDSTPGMSAYEASIRAGLKGPMSLYRLLDQRERPTWPRCVTCGRPYRPGATLPLKQADKGWKDLL